MPCQNRGEYQGYGLASSFLGFVVLCCGARVVIRDERANAEGAGSQLRVSFSIIVPRPRFFATIYSSGGVGIARTRQILRAVPRFTTLCRGTGAIAELVGLNQKSCFLPW